MKKLFYCAAVLATMFFTACQQENLEPSEKGTTVSFSVEVPGLAATKADVVDDGSNINDLVYAVYKVSDEATTLEEAVDAWSAATRVYQVNQTTTSFEGGRTKVELELLNDQNYVVLFWAQVDDVWVPAGTDFDLTNITYPANMVSSNSDLAAFSGATFVAGDDVEKNIKREVTLTRPFAQINIGTTLPKAFDVEFDNSKVTVRKAGETFNVASQTVTGNKEVVFAESALPSNYLNVQGDATNYTYVAMNYVFANGVVEVEYDINTKLGLVNKTIPAVPVEKNFRTNIIGNLLTSNATYEIKLDDTWGDPATEVYVWNGSEIEAPTEIDANHYEIARPSELAWLAAAVNGTLPETKAASAPLTFAGKTFTLTENVDLNGMEWTPIGNSTNKFQGTFDGNGKTVKNLVISGNNSYVGLFGFTTDGAIRNLTIENAKVSGRVGVGVVAGSPYTSTLENITVKGHVEVNGMSYVGGVGGRNAYAGWNNIKVEVDGTSYVKAHSIENGAAYRSYVGGVVGFIGEDPKLFKDITSNIDVQGATCDVGGLFGIAHYGNKFENCSCSGDVEIYAAEETAEAEEIGGIAGVWNNDGSDVVMTECKFTGNIKTNIDRATVWYDNLVGKPYSENGNGRLIIDGIVVVASANTLQAAINGAVEGETITFVADVESTDGFVITDKKITIDLDGNTFTVSEGAGTNNRNFKINGSSVVTIKNGTMIAAGDYSSGAYGTIRTEGSAKVTLDNVKLYNYRGNGLNVKALSGTTVTINRSEVYSEYGGGIESAGGVIELNDVTVEQKGMYTAPYNSMAISVNGGGTVTVNSGAYSTECLTAEEANNQGSSHGPWCAGVLNSGGTLIIKGGTFSNDNYGDNSLATNARGLLLADTGANIQIEGGDFNAMAKIIDIQNNLGDATKNPKATLKGGTYSSNPLTYNGLISLAEGYVVKETDSKFKVFEYRPAAKVGNTEYGSIEEAIANWTNNATLTLLSDVTLSDVVTLKSTEHHILNLSTYTMTAASGKNAIEITCEGRTSASYALTVNADATNPGGITATGKSCIYYKKSGTTKDRPIILINNGVFTGSYSINSTSNGNTNCPQVWINGGVFNSYMNLTKNLLKVSGGTFHAAINCTGDSSAYRQFSGGRFKSWQYMTADGLGKFWVGTAKDTYDVGVYVDKQGYLVVGGPVITEAPGANFEKKSYSAWSSYLKYSSAAEYGLYCEK